MVKKELGLIAAGILSLAGSVGLENRIDYKIEKANRPVREYVEKGLAVPNGVVNKSYDDQQSLEKTKEVIQAGGCVSYSILMGLGFGLLLTNRRKIKEERIYNEIRRST